jgi:hypothetical protein
VKTTEFIEEFQELQRKTRKEYTQSGIQEEYDTFIYKNSQTLEDEFHKQNEFRTTIRGLKVRGVFSSEVEASAKAKRLQKQEWLQAPVVPDMKPEHQLQLDEWRQLMGMLLSLPPGSALQTGVLQCGVRFAQNVLGYCHGLAPGADPDLLSGPMVRWDEDMVSVLSWPALPFPH